MAAFEDDSSDSFGEYPFMPEATRLASGSTGLSLPGGSPDPESAHSGMIGRTFSMVAGFEVTLYLGKEFVASIDASCRTFGIRSARVSRLCFNTDGVADRHMSPL